MDDLNHSFSLVWERVTGEAQPSPLFSLMEEENALRCSLCALSRRVRELGEDKAASEKRLRRMQAERFLLTGDTCALSPTASRPEPVLTALRDIYCRASTLSRRYSDGGKEAFAAETAALSEKAKRLLFCRGFSLREGN